MKVFYLAERFGQLRFVRAIVCFCLHSLLEEAFAVAVQLRLALVFAMCQVSSAIPLVVHNPKGSHRGLPYDAANQEKADDLFHGGKGIVLIKIKVTGVLTVPDISCA